MSQFVSQISILGATCDAAANDAATEQQQRSHREVLLEPWSSASHIDASHSRQPLVKGERLVRHEVNAVMEDWRNMQSLKDTLYMLNIGLVSLQPL